MELHRKEIEITFVDFDDLQDVSRIEQDCFSEPWSYDSFKQELVGEKSFFKVIKVNSNVAGYLVMACVCGEGYITNLAIDSKFRRQGMGSLILDDCILYALKNGLNFISLEVRTSNKSAIKLYCSKKFEIVGKRKNFYRDPVEDAYIMTRYF